MSAKLFSETLPEKGILFLGGHQNMVKKLHNLYPRWTYISDEKLPKISTINVSVIFYWTAHGSHKIMRFAMKRIPENTSILYVTATNIPLLLQQMQQQWKDTHKIQRGK